MQKGKSLVKSQFRKDLVNFPCFQKLLIQKVCFKNFLFHLYIYPPDSQKSDGGANT